VADAGFHQPAIPARLYDQPARSPAANDVTRARSSELRHTGNLAPSVSAIHRDRWATPGSSCTGRGMVSVQLSSRPAERGNSLPGELSTKSKVLRPGHSAEEATDGAPIFACFSIEKRLQPRHVLSGRAHAEARDVRVPRSSGRVAPQIPGLLHGLVHYTTPPYINPAFS